MDYQNTSPLKPNFLNNPVLQSRWFIIFVIICVFIFFALGIAGDYYLKIKSTDNKPKPTVVSTLPKSKACTQEAQICPDGSSVGRTGPNCEFEECPSGQSEGKKFTGIIASISYNCHMDGICGIEVGKDFVVVDSGESLNTREAKGTVPDGLLDENKKNKFLGKNVEVFAKSSDGKINSYTLFGNSRFYVKLVDNTTTQIFCGGIAGKICPSGYYCKYDGTYPDAGGTCIEEVLTKFSCPKNEYVDCMPGPNKDKNIECSPNFLQWAQTNCPNFKVAY